MRSLIAVGVALGLSGCVTSYSVAPPAEWRRAASSEVIAGSRDEVWDKAVPRLAQRFFVINNIDRASGLLNVSYGGDPQPFVDCGSMTVSTPGISDQPPVPLAFPQTSYVATLVEVNPYGATTAVRRTVELEGRMNLVFQAETPTSTRVTVNTRYIVTARWNQASAGPAAMFPGSGVAGFNAQEPGLLPGPIGAPTATCVSTGELERRVLRVIRGD